MASKGSSGTSRSSKGATASARGPASTTTKSAVSSSRGSTGATSASTGGAASVKPTSAAASSDGPVSRYQVYKSYGGAQNFALSHGLRLYNDDDVQEMKAIADAYRWGEYNNR